MIRPLKYNPPTRPALSVVHQDDDLLVLNKPSGLLSVAGKHIDHADCLEARAKKTFANARIVHRLDMDTSGVIVLARNKKAHRHLGLQFERRHIKKSYIARVWGQLSADCGQIDLPLICDWPNRPRQMVDFERGKKSRTNWQVIGRAQNVTTVLLRPTTGRSHQLRIHMLSLGHPILGDNIYAHQKALDSADRLQLHALDLEMYHPSSGKVLKFKAPCPFPV